MDTIIQQTDVTRHCCYGRCNSDSRYAYKEHIRVRWLQFSKPKKDLEKYLLWINVCAREHFIVKKMNNKDNHLQQDVKKTTHSIIIPLQTRLTWHSQVAEK